MREIVTLAACAAALTGLAACGEEKGAGGLTAEESRKLDEHANNLDSQTIDASPDSLVANDEWIQAETGQAAAAGNEAANSPAANGQ
jgi:hypothetical protein